MDIANSEKQEEMMNIKNNNMQDDIFNDIHDYEKKYDPWEKNEIHHLSIIFY